MQHQTTFTLRNAERYLYTPPGHENLGGISRLVGKRSLGLTDHGYLPPRLVA